MAADSFTSVSSRNVFQRLGDSIKGVLFGILLFVIAFPVLWTNEGRAVKRARTLTEGAGAVVSVAADAVDPNHEGALVHVTGVATTTNTVTDPEFGIAVTALRLVRDVEMYQWIENVSTEKKTKVGGTEETVTTYDYAKEWASGLTSSSSFEHPEGHQNPSAMPFSGSSWSAGTVTLGAFTLPPSMVGRIGGSEAVPVTDATVAALPPAIRENAHVSGPGIYLGTAPSTPEVGDLQVRFSKVPPTDVSLIARQSGNSFSPYQMAQGSIDELRTGTFTAAQMFEMAQRENTILTWVLRGVGFLLMAFGLGMVFAPLGVAGDVLPFLGNLLRLGTGLVAGVLAFAFSLVTIAVAWIVYRPLLGLILLAVAVGALVMIKSMSSKQAPVPAVPSAAPPPPPA